MKLLLLKNDKFVYYSVIITVQILILSIRKFKKTRSTELFSIILYYIYLIFLFIENYVQEEICMSVVKASKYYNDLFY